MKAFLINLERAKERLISCEKEFKKTPKDFRAKWNYKAKWDGN